MRHTRHAVIGTITAVLALGALFAAPVAAQAKAPAQARHRHHQVQRYVALGDSYTAGPLIPTTEMTDGCLRSDHNYPSLIAKSVHAKKFVDVSCSGADSTNMTGSQNTGTTVVPPQFDALNRKTDLVSVSIGGNDFNVFSTLVGYCPTLRASDPTGHPCQTAFATPHGNTLLNDVKMTQKRVTKVVRQVHRLAPHARVLVVGYPQIVPSHGTCPALLPLADGDYRYGLRIGRALTDALRHAARVTGSRYVNIFRASAGHSICAKNPWINGQFLAPNRALNFHPFAVEQRAVARLAVHDLARSHRR